MPCEELLDHVGFGRGAARSRQRSVLPFGRDSLPASHDFIFVGDFGGYVLNELRTFVQRPLLSVHDGESSMESVMLPL